MKTDPASIQKRLLQTLIVFEALLISLCAWAGYQMATSHGGSILSATPILLLAAAETMRIPLSGWATRLPWRGKILSAIVLIAIAIGTAESLVLVFEIFVQNRVAAITAAQDRVSLAQAPQAEAQKAYDAALAAKHAAREDAARLDALIGAQMAHPPAMPALSGKTCGLGGRSTCAGDRAAQSTYASARKEHDAALAALRVERKEAQDRIDRAVVPPMNPQASADLQAAKRDLLVELASSPMHRLTGTLFGEPVEAVTQEQFAVVKKWAVVALSVAFATMSAVVSFVAHMDPVTPSESKLSRALRMWIARRRKQIIAIREVPGPEKVVEVVKEIPVPGPERTIIRWLPASEQPQRPDRRRGLGRYAMPNGESLKHIGE